MTDTIEGTATEEPSVEIVTAASPSLAVVPNVEASDLVARLAVIRGAMATAMEEGIDYGLIPGANKPSLFKPGAEKLGVLFQLDVQIVNEKTWGPGDHLTVVSHATVYHAPTQTRMGYGEGICTTREKKYGKRQERRKCPDCGEAAIIKGKEEYGGGWVCHKKQGGCGHKWKDGAEVIESQVTGEIDNPEIPDLWNTVDKMASKRSRIDAILAVTGASALFTQDLEDMGDHSPAVADPAPALPRILTDEERAKVNEAIMAAGLKIPETYAAVQVGSRGITVEDARAIRRLLDESASVAEARVAMSEHDAAIEF